MFLAVPVLICAALLPLFVQNTAEIRGKVTDSTGAVLPGVLVTLTNKGGNQERTQTANGEGNYLFASLSNGDYVLTGTESLSQAQQVRIIGEVLGRRITFEELSPDGFRRETEGSWPRPVVDMLLDAWGATMGRPAFITSTVFDILGSPPRSFRRWAADHASAFMEGPTP